MFSGLGSFAMSCWKPVQRYARMNRDDDEESSSSVVDPLVWSKDLLKHSCGEFSFAVVQANEVLEDQSQVDTGPNDTFVGVYDGHGGPDTAKYICDNLLRHLMRLVREHGTISEDIIRSAYSATEEGFLTLVRRSLGIKPLIAAIGSCCLVGVICRGTLYIANVGDSRAVIGSLGRSNKIVAEQLTRDHNASLEEIRQELRSLHPDDSQIVILREGVWRVKGIIQVSRSIGDAYLKRPEFALDRSFPRFHLPEPIRRPVLTAEPSIQSRDLQTNDKFLIFASDGLWEHLTNQEAAEIVHNSPRMGIAKRLLNRALREAARKGQMRYDDLKRVGKGSRRQFHDDITVVVMFLDIGQENLSVPEISVRGFVDTIGPSDFNIQQG